MEQGKAKRKQTTLLPKHVWAIRTRLHMLGRETLSRALQLIIDSKLRECDLVRLRMLDVAPRGYAVDRASIRRRKTCQPVRFEITEHTKLAIDAKSPRQWTSENPGEADMFRSTLNVP
jgi:hypothetical protein